MHVAIIRRRAASALVAFLASIALAIGVRPDDRSRVT